MGNLNLELRCALDSVTFARIKLGFDPDPWQSDLLRSPSSRVLLNCSRQSGKSTTAAIVGVHTAIFVPDSLSLLVSPSLRQSRELFAKVSGFLKTMEPRPRMDEDNRLSFTLANGARVVCLPGSADTIRGFSAPDLIVEDEAAFVDDGLYRAIRPMLAVSNGRLILMSTPNGKRGHFHEAWTGDEDWQRVRVPAEDCPRISKEFLASERRSLGEYWFRQEYGCEFSDSAAQMFRSVDIARAITEDVKPLFEAVDTGLKPLFGDHAA